MTGSKAFGSKKWNNMRQLVLFALLNVLDNEWLGSSLVPIFFGFSTLGGHFCWKE